MRRSPQLRAHVEATIDFPTEEIDFLADRALRRAAGRACARNARPCRPAAQQGRLLTEGLTVVIAGAPNAGKSTLLNRLAGHEAAIVTRDPRHDARSCCASASSSRACRSCCSTPPGCATARDAIEAEGMRRARAAMAQADRVLFLVDALARSAARLGFAAERDAAAGECAGDLVYNKIDLLGARASGARAAGHCGRHGCWRLSALNGSRARCAAPPSA